MNSQPPVSPAAIHADALQAASTGSLQGKRLLMVAHSNSIHTSRWARFFQSRGMEVLVISPLPDPIAGVPVQVFPPRKTWYHRIPRLHLYLDHRHWRRAVEEFGPDVVHVHYPDGGPRNRFYLKGLPALVTSTWGSEVVESEGFTLSRKHKVGVRAALALSKVVTATTRFLARVTASYCPPGTTIHVIPFGVDCDVFHPADPAQARGPSGERSGLAGQFRIGFMKNLERKYGPEVLIEAFAPITRQFPGAKLLMCGRGPELEPLQQRVRKLGLTPNVEFLGWVPQAQMVSLVQSVDLAVMPSTCQESFGVAALEASACEVPVVATRVGGVGEAVVDGQTGLLVPPADPQALAQACIDLLGDAERRRAMGIAGRRFVQTTYPWDKSTALMASVYEQLLAGKPVITPEMMIAGKDAPAAI